MQFLSAEVGNSLDGPSVLELGRHAFAQATACARNHPLLLLLIPRSHANMPSLSLPLGQRLTNFFYKGPDCNILDSLASPHLCHQEAKAATGDT